MSPPKSTPSVWKMTIADVSNEPIPENELIEIYRWLDKSKFSRSKKTSVQRDFADGVMMAELVAQNIPRLVDLFNYIPASATAKKRENWKLLNTKVFRKMRFQVTPDLIAKVANAEPGMIEQVLYRLRPIALLGPLAVMSPDERLEQVKSRFTNVQRQYSKLDGSANEDEHRPRTARSTSFSSVASIKHPEEQLRSLTKKKSPRARRTTDRSTDTETDDENDETTIRPSTASSRPKCLGNLSQSRPQSAISDYNELRKGKSNTERDYEKKPKLGRNKPVRKQAEGDGSSAKDKNDNDEVYDEVFCDSAQKDDNGDDDEDYACKEEEVTQRKKKRVRKYEYREDYIFNGMKIGHTTYSLPCSQNEIGNASKSKSQTRGVI